MTMPTRIERDELHALTGQGAQLVEVLVRDYFAGKADWLAADLPFEGTAQLAGMFTRRGVATVGERTTAAEALRLLEAQGFGPVVVINQAGVVMASAYRDQLASPPGRLRSRR
jgi:hypothetical protein